MLALFSIHGPWKEYAVPELDSVLNLWHAHIPDHLRWDPAREDQVFFDQSVALHCAFYHLQILIHRALLRKSAPAVRELISGWRLKLELTDSVRTAVPGDLYNCCTGMYQHSGHPVAAQQ